MGIHKSYPYSHQLIVFNKIKDFLQRDTRGHGESLKKGEDFISVLYVTARQFTDYERMTNDLGIQKEFLKMPAALAKVGNPYGGVNKNHG